MVAKLKDKVAEWKLTQQVSQQFRSFPMLAPMREGRG